MVVWITGASSGGSVGEGDGAGASCAGRRFLLVDDVRTTGSTALSCAETLVRAGAARVDLLAVCIAPGLARGRQKSLRGRFRPRREG